MNIAVITFPGANGLDCYHGLQDALGTSAQAIQVELVPHTVTELDMYEVIVLPGGFSYGDYMRSGAIAGHTPVVQALHEANQQGKIIVGIGNGFQILTEVGLLPGVLRKNEGQRFVCRSIQLEVANAETPFTALYEAGEQIALPIAHESGNYYCDEDTLQQLESSNRVVLRYVDNPNGSQGDIAAIVNEQGNVLGMMPHPERAVNELLGSIDGVRLFTSIMNTWRERHGSAS